VVLCKYTYFVGERVTRALRKERKETKGKGERVRKRKGDRRREKEIKGK
jgi:hypothetical protein